uniref:Uncharacterized protein n=2 Tax=Sexangularia sp. CB-2014 TaxID=1486929 RepID=A0A7S1VGG4_9EUKA|mmetsp:Transcript_3245/g.10673  ORF Transcript_3245/g.10673 Transcript_3245/m.10673 type:complete len:118 (+) Transcript_3245:543-896(+)
MGWADEVLYLHMMAHHGPQMLRLHGWLGQFSCETTELHNKSLQRTAANAMSKTNQSGQLTKRKLTVLANADKQLDSNLGKRRQYKARRAIDDPGIEVERRKRVKAYHGGAQLKRERA